MLLEQRNQPLVLLHLLSGCPDIFQYNLHLHQLLKSALVAANDHDYLSLDVVLPKE
jgi:hypothetical protein